MSLKQSLIAEYPNRQHSHANSQSEYLAPKVGTLVKMFRSPGCIDQTLLCWHNFKHNFKHNTSSLSWDQAPSCYSLTNTKLQQLDRQFIDIPY